MSEVIDLAEHQPHLTVLTDEAVHVVPVSLVRDWIRGVGEPPQDLVRTVLREWLEAIEGARRST